MKRATFILLVAMLWLSAFLSGACSGAGKKVDLTSKIELIASTPGDSIIKSILHLSADQGIDFIRWNLQISTGPGDSAWVLNILFGESQPNTLGFKGGGESLIIRGKYTKVNHKTDELSGEIYHLKSDQQQTTISILKLNDNLFHLLTPDNRLMVGNGGWSYTLNRETPLAGVSASLPKLSKSSVLLSDTARQTIFVGRTPCQEISKEFQLQVTPGCFKTKWKLTLYRDPETKLPTTYNLKRTNNRMNDLTGKWTIIRGTKDNPDAIIYRLDPDQPDKSISLWVANNNVLFFLDGKLQPFTGNADFSYTLNREMPDSN